ncbi:MAG: UDP-3-O-acyl-N-acetylglucosamine deacetylase [Rhodospirillales bacterium]|nr:UDP-3-O-acyl-N-acetylglucosamine deacetylase [Alphaproteobacteria bacterium]USO04802.1 MAG: UDP-3-O-acyl-N-acetylglucosamine deacetylase [Rhodospirillales bacterium]
MQNTLQKQVSLKGIGLHSGADITLNISPAEVDTGIVFVRSDITDKNNIIPARWDHVVDTQLCTVIGNKDGASVATIEHLMSALRGCNIDNVRIELDGAEVPVMDGSAMPFVQLIERAGIAVQDAPRRVLRVLKEVSVEKDGKQVSLCPSEGAVFGGEIEFDHPEIGQQHFETRLLNGNFKHDIATARTFGFLHEVEWMRSQGLALGGSLDNAIVLDQGHVMNPEGLRFNDEFIRHKLLDAIGDLYLAGAPIMGAYDGYKAGHEMNNLILHALFADEEAYEWVNEMPPQAARRKNKRPVARTVEIQACA